MLWRDQRIVNRGPSGDRPSLTRPPSPRDSRMAHTRLTRVSELSGRHSGIALLAPRWKVRMRPSSMLIGLVLLGCGASSVTPAEPLPDGTHLTLIASADSIRVGQELDLVPIYRDGVGNLLPTPPLTWSVDNPALATIASGRLHANALGTVHVKASTGTAEAAYAVEILPIDPSEIRIDPAPAPMRPGGIQVMSASVYAVANYRLSGAPVTWSSSRPEIATIDAGGVITALVPGITTLTATSGPLSATTTLNVLPSIAGAIHLSSFGRALHPGEQATPTVEVLSTTGLTLDAGRIVWTSSSPQVATVSFAGQVTAVAPGQTRITASADSAAAEITVNVLRVPGPTLPGQGLIAFFRLTGADTSIEVRRTDGSLVVSTRVTAPPSPFGDPPRLSLSPTGTVVTFDCLPAICDLTVPGGTVTTRTMPPGTYMHPAWFATGEGLAFEFGYARLGLQDLGSGGTLTYEAIGYASAPAPSPDGRYMLYACDGTVQIDDPDDICLLDSSTGTSSVFHWTASLPSWSNNGTLAYLTGIGLDELLVVEPFQANRNPNSPGAQEYPGFSDVTEMAWSPDGSRLALVRGGRLWIAEMPGVANLVEFAHVDGSTIASVSWR